MIYRSDSLLVPVWEGDEVDGQPDYVGDLLLGVMQTCAKKEGIVLGIDNVLPFKMEDPDIADIE